MLQSKCYPKVMPTGIDKDRSEVDIYEKEQEISIEMGKRWCKRKRKLVALRKNKWHKKPWVRVR